MSRVYVPPNTDDLIKNYLGGNSENAVAIRHGVSRGTIRRILLENGISPRTQSEAERVKWSRMDSNSRTAQTVASHNAIRGTKRGPADLHLRALGRQANLSQDTPTEKALGAMLAARGFAYTPQLAVGPYNIDLAIHEPAIAVEVAGHSGKQMTKSPIAPWYSKRTPYLLDEGWHIIIVTIDGVRNMLTVGAADYIATWAEELRRNPPFWREYRVIRGNGQLKAFLSAEYQNGARIPATHRGLKPSRLD